MQRKAAVLMPIFARQPHDVVFIERAHHLRRHAGQIGFPGGALDASDALDLARAALRETEEEIGLDRSAVTIVAELPAIRQRTGGFEVTPFVGVVAGAPSLRLDRNEVAAVHHVPLAAILRAGAVHAGIEIVGDRRVETNVFDAGAVHVWGLTGAILASFVAAYAVPASALRRALDERLDP